MTKQDTIDYNDYYTTTEFTKMLEIKYPNIVFDTITFTRTLKTYDGGAYKHLLKKKANINLFPKEFVDGIDFSFMEIAREIKLGGVFINLLDLHFLGGISEYTTSKLLGVDYHSLVRMIEKGEIFSYINAEKRLIRKEDVFAWCEFKEKYIGIEQILAKFIEEIDESIRGTKRFYDIRIKEMYRSGVFDKFRGIPERETPFRTVTQNEIYVDKKYTNEVYQLVIEQMIKESVKGYGTKEDKVKYRIESINNPKIRLTLKELMDFATTRLSTLTRPNPNLYFDILDNIESLDKNITKCNNEEVEDILSKLSTKASKTEFCMFLRALKDRKKTTYTSLSYDEQHNKTETKRHLPYTEEQYMRFGFLVLSDSHIWYESYLEKALEKRVYASAWLYAVLHYVSAWRAGDVHDRFPRPNLHMEPQEYLDKVRSKEVKKEEALEILEQINIQLKMTNMKPSKTKSYSTPKLVMEIPESLYILIGTLVGIAEAHFQLSPDIRKKGLISKECRTLKTQREFFGDEFIKIFGEDKFSNLRAVKNYEVLLARKGEEEELGTGYVLASIARSHKFNFDKKARTTMVYLQYYKEMGDSEVIVRELFERGVCSFVPYLLTQVVSGKETMISLNPEERTAKIKEIAPFDAYDAEMLVQRYNEVLESAKEKVSTMIEEAVEDGVDAKELARGVLLNIIYNEAPSKQGKLPCMIIAQGRECLYPLRESCVGCGHEIYLKSCLFELGDRIQRAKKDASLSETQGSINKNILMIKNVLVPIASEILISLKEIYKIENIEEYKKLLQ